MRVFEEKPMFSGVITALVTPFSNGKLDEARLKEQIAYQIAGGVSGVVPVGTTGESPTLDFDEHERVIELTVETVRASGAKVAVLAGTGANATPEALRLQKFAKQVGATAGLSVNPYYNKPSQEGMYRHFMTVADAVDLPVVLYNIPGRTGVNMAPATIARLAKHPNIVAVKESAGSCEQVTEIRSLCGITVLSGDDPLTLPFMALGASGVVSVLSNLLPAEVVKMVRLFKEGHLTDAAALHTRFFPLIRGLFMDGNPAGIKWAMRLAGRDSAELRLPIVEPSEATKALLAKEVAAWGLVK